MITYKPNTFFYSLTYISPVLYLLGFSQISFFRCIIEYKLHIQIHYNFYSI